MNTISWIEFVAFAEVCGIDLPAIFAKVFQYRGSLSNFQEISQGIFSTTPVAQISSQLKVSDRQVNRWFKGESIPYFCDVLALTDCCSVSMTAFVYELAKTDDIPFIGKRIRSALDQIALSFDLPASQLVLYALQLEGYQQQEHSIDYLGRHTGLSTGDLEHCLQQLEKHNFISWNGNFYEVIDIDTTSQAIAIYPEWQQEVEKKIFWLDDSTKKLRSHLRKEAKPLDYSRFGHLTFKCSAQCLEEISDASTRFFAEIRTIAERDATSRQANHVALLNLSLIDFCEFPPEA